MIDKPKTTKPKTEKPEKPEKDDGPLPDFGNLNIMKRLKRIEKRLDRVEDILEAGGHGKAPEIKDED